MDTWVVELDNDNFSYVWADSKEEAEQEANKEFGNDWLYVHKEDEE